MDYKLAFVYGRVSSKSQKYNTSNPEQIQKCKQYAKLYNYIVIDSFEDVSSGANINRKCYKLMMNRISEVNAIIVHKLDRLHRSLKNLLCLKESLDKLLVSIISVTEQINTLTPQGKLFFNIIGSFAEFEKDIITQRTDQGKNVRFREGKRTCGQIPFGYKRKEDSTDIVIDEKYSIIVNHIFKLKSKGFSFRKVANMIKILHGININYQTIHYMIKNPIYKGELINTFKGEKYKIKVPNIISPQIWNKLNNDNGELQFSKETIEKNGSQSIDKV